MCTILCDSLVWGMAASNCNYGPNWQSADVEDLVPWIRGMGTVVLRVADCLWCGASLRLPFLTSVSVLKGDPKADTKAWAFQQEDKSS